MTPKLNSPIPRLFNIILALLVVLFGLVGVMMYQNYNDNRVTLKVQCAYKDAALSSLVCRDLLLNK